MAVNLNLKCMCHKLYTSVSRYYQKCSVSVYVYIMLLNVLDIEIDNTVWSNPALTIQLN